MQNRLRRMIVAVLLGGALAFGVIGGGSLAQPSAAYACPGGGNGGSGGC